MHTPTLDRTITYVPNTGAPGRCRLRTYEQDRVAVVTELGDNCAMSVTNAIEVVGAVVEAIIDRRFADGGWQLVEHYDEHSYSDTRAVPPAVPLSLVVFVGRTRHGQVQGPIWAPLPGSLAWLTAALEATPAADREPVA